MADSVAQLQEAQRNDVVLGTVVQKDSKGRPIIYPRLEIDVFITDAPVCNLFLLALAELQRWDVQDKPWSWFGICSIHGLPPGPWQGLTQDTAVRTGQFPAWDPNHPDPRFDPRKRNQMGDTSRGYCSHNSVLFPSWHRPYLAMMEQAICLKMHEIAKWYSRPGDRVKYQDAAYRFRMPYFDPYLARVLLEEDRKNELKWQCGTPQVLSARFVKVFRWDDPDYPLDIENPLYTYYFPTVQANGPPKYTFDTNEPFKFRNLWGGWGRFRTAADQAALERQIKSMITPNRRTVRSPSVKDGESNHTRMQQTWAKMMRPAGANLYNLFAKQASYAHFSNKAWMLPTREGDPSKFERDAEEEEIVKHSLEAYHDAGHGWIGQADMTGGIQPQGHMLVVPYSCYDPIFWLHHWSATTV